MSFIDVTSTIHRLRRVFRANATFYATGGSPRWGGSARSTIYLAREAAPWLQ
jgi:hypothetical protein